MTVDNYSVVKEPPDAIDELAEHAASLQAVRFRFFCTGGATPIAKLIGFVKSRKELHRRGAKSAEEIIFGRHKGDSLRSRPTLSRSSILELYVVATPASRRGERSSHGMTETPKRWEKLSSSEVGRYSPKRRFPLRLRRKPSAARAAIMTSRMPVGGTIFVSDKQARLKPCLRCGYSLRHNIDAKNCPECGLAVRISLADNRALEWSNPSWQRFLAFAFTILAFGFLCKFLSAVLDWVVVGVRYGYLPSSDRALTMWRLSQRLNETAPIAYGAAYCLLIRGEGRHPDLSRPVRYICVVFGIIVLSLGLIWVAVRFGFLRGLPDSIYDLLWNLLFGPWIPLVILVLAGTYALVIGKRGRSPLLAKMSQLPAWPAMAGVVIWLFGFERLFWPFRPIVWGLLFPLSMIAMLALTIHVLLRGAREAKANWVSDP